MAASEASAFQTFLQSETSSFESSRIMTENAPIFLLTLQCADAPGIVAAVATAISERGGNIRESHQFEDVDTGKFFMRVRFEARDGATIEDFRHKLKPVVERFGMRHEIVEEAVRDRVVIMVSKMDHCLNDLIYRWKSGDLKMDIVAIVSNHETCRPLAEAIGVPYHCWPVTKDNKAEQEARLIELVDREHVDLVVLARYMQILSDGTSKKLFGKVINIHHSFLPSFIGARPYHRAHERGVKLIGATAHYVTEDLDEGPIIEQDVERVKHADRADTLVRIGRDIESRVLSRAIKWQLERRVLINDRKTVVFR